MVHDLIPIRLQPRFLQLLLKYIHLQYIKHKIVKLSLALREHKLARILNTVQSSKLAN